jgi:hypothetical protein
MRYNKETHTMFFNPQPPADKPESDVPADIPADVPVEDPANTPDDVHADVPAHDGAPLSDLTRHRSALNLTAIGLISLLSAWAVYAANDKDMGKSGKNKLEHGQQFENARPPKDSIEARERREDREHAAVHPGEPHKGPPGHRGNPAYPGHPNPPGFEGPNGKPTFMNRKMRGHQHHEDRPARTSSDAKHWQDKRMWRQPGTWAGADTWANARAKDWTKERTTWPLRGGYGGAFITQAEYEKHYTVSHNFRIGDQPRMKNGYAHFKHAGDHFVIVDPYPENWNEKWHSSDDVYLEYNQGYYLHNRQHPGSPLAVMALE